MVLAGRVGTRSDPRTNSVRRETGEAVNWSAVAQRAFREAIAIHLIRKDHTNMENVVERLRASKERFEGRELENGKKVGARWAKTEAEFYELIGVGIFEPDNVVDLSVDDLQFLIDPDGEMTRDGWAEFWESHYGRSNPSAAFIWGFIQGAKEVHDEIADQI
jgi:hypothetical protein